MATSSTSVTETLEGMTPTKAAVPATSSSPLQDLPCWDGPEGTGDGRRGRLPAKLAKAAKESKLEGPTPPA